MVAHPDDAGAWGALGDAQAAADQLDEAEHAYRTAARLGGASAELYARLGFLLYARGDDVDALEMLRFAEKGGAKLPMLERTIAELETRRPEPPDAGSVAPEAPTPDASWVAASLDAAGSPRVCSVKIARRSPRGGFLVGLTMGGHPAMLMVDTGASMTVMTERFLADSSAIIDEERTVEAVTANGTTRFPTALVHGVTLEDREVDRARVAVCRDCGVEAIADGLLGLDLMAAFGVSLDAVSGTLHFRDCGHLR